ncbi:hypothetical protein N7448_009990 [Penicillium atrosanguineum]|nr:hypothetical protein N7448_009990 [Penicillium atrosanguineum]
MATVVQSRTTQATDTISFPVLTYTDAAPRDDLRTLDNTSQRIKEQGVVTQRDFRRPQTADTGTDRKAPPGLGASFDFRLTAPPDEAIPSSARSCNSPLGPKMIGIALGSPGMLDSQEGLPPPRFNTLIFAQPQPGQSPPRKSKWKKIGGLFRAKNALASPTQAVRSDQNNIPRPNEVLLANQQQMKRRKGLTEEWPRIEIDPKSKTDRKYPSTQRSRKCSLSRKTPPRDISESLGPRLDVNIPDIQMERYSVMFSNVMNKNRRPNLLARRAKTLNSLSVPSNQVFLAASVKPPPVPIRRATSPARSSFTLFPASRPSKATQPSKAAQILGIQNIPQNFSRGPSPLLRSNTIPVESPSRSPLEPPFRGIHSNNSVSSIESPLAGNAFDSQMNTSRSSNSYLRKEDKPLPAIKSEQQTQPRSRKMSPQDIRAVQSSLKQPQSVPQTEDEPPANNQSRRKRPNLTINTGHEPPPPPAKDAKENSSSKSAPEIVAPALKTTAEPMMITESPEVLAPKRNPLRVNTSASPLERSDPKPNPVRTNILASPLEMAGSRPIAFQANTASPVDGSRSTPLRVNMDSPLERSSPRPTPLPANTTASPTNITTANTNALQANITASPLEMSNPKPIQLGASMASPMERAEENPIACEYRLAYGETKTSPNARKHNVSSREAGQTDPVACKYVISFRCIRSQSESITSRATPQSARG